MTKEDFYRQAVLNSISILTPSYWDSQDTTIKNGAYTVIKFAKELTNQVFEEEE